MYHNIEILTLETAGIDKTNILHYKASLERQKILKDGRTPDGAAIPQSLTRHEDWTFFYFLLQLQCK